MSCFVLHELGFSALNIVFYTAIIDFVLVI